MRHEMRADVSCVVSVAAALLAGILVILVALIALPRPAGAITICQPDMGGPARGYWRWRIVDGKKCFYTGDRNLEKSQLRWPTEEEAEKVIERHFYTREELQREFPDPPVVLPPPEPGSFEDRWGIPSKVR